MLGIRVVQEQTSQSIIRKLLQEQLARDHSYLQLVIIDIFFNRNCTLEGGRTESHEHIDFDRYCKLLKKSNYVVIATQKRPSLITE